MPDEAHEYADDFHALAQLAEVFLQFVSALGEGDAADISEERVVDLAARCMPRGQAVGLALQDDGRLTTVAATSEVCGRIDRIRASVGEGPSLDAIETNDVVVCGHLAQDPRWPAFSRRVLAETSVTSVLTYRLYLGRRFRGALTFYSDWPYVFDDIAVATGAIFAAYASLALQHRFLLDQPVPGPRATSVHMEIGVAIGILMAGMRVDTEGAYRRLHEAGRHLRQSLPETARQVIDSGGLPPQA